MTVHPLYDSLVREMLMGWKKELWPEWQIECDIGSGGYGTVYKIKREDIGGAYFAALKVVSLPHDKHEIENLHLKNMTDEQISDYYHNMVLRICKEISVMERLKGNSNIVSYEDHKIVAHTNDPGWDILIRMELLTSLSKYLETHSISEGDVCKIGLDICKALELCEKENIIHRDVKPGNIFVSDFGDFKLGDFGLAKHIELNDEATIRQGTFNYMAPEVYRGDRYDFTIDLYALGLILYTFLNRGRAPFFPLPPAVITGEISDAANKRRLNLELLPKPADASAFMASVILKACAPNPRNRYQSAVDMYKDLKRCEALQPALTAGKKISGFTKKCVDAIPDMITPFIPDETINESPAGADKEKTMSDFFSQPGDL